MCAARPPLIAAAPQQTGWGCPRIGEAHPSRSGTRQPLQAAACTVRRLPHALLFHLTASQFVSANRSPSHRNRVTTVPIQQNPLIVERSGCRFRCRQVSGLSHRAGPRCGLRGQASLARGAAPWTPGGVRRRLRFVSSCQSKYLLVTSGH